MITQQTALYNMPDDATIARYSFIIVTFAITSAQIVHIRAVNPSATIYAYRNFTCANSEPEATLFRSNGWLLHDYNSAEVHPPSIATEYAVDPGNDEYRTWIVNWCKDRAKEGYDGVFADNQPNPTYPASWSLGKAVNPRTGATYLDLDWFNDTRSLCKDAKAVINIVGNGIPQGDGTYGYWSNKSRCDTINNDIDGVMIEGPIGWTLADVNSRSAMIWKQNIDCVTELAKTGKLVLFSNSGSADMETDSVAKFTYCSYMLVAKPNTFIKFRGLTYMSGTYWSGLINIDPGEPIGEMYQSGSEYRRNYQRGYFSVNPSNRTSEYVVNMTKPYVDGLQLKDPSGKMLNLMHWNCRDNVIEDDVKWLHDKGYNAVRLVILWQTIEASEGKLNWSNMDNIIALCEKYGMWTILDFHQWHYSPYFVWSGYGQGSGFPAWLPKKYGYANSATGVQAFIDDFFMKRGNGASTWSEFFAFWGKLLARYATKPHVFAIEFNEPMVGASHENAARTACSERYKEMITQVRAVEPQIVFIQHHIDTGYNVNLGFSNVMGTKSAYAEYGVGTTKAQIDSYFTNRKAEWNTKLKLPYVISETGKQPGDQVGADQFFVDLMESYKRICNGGNTMVGFWKYEKAATSGGYVTPRQANGTDSWMQSILVKFLPPNLLSTNKLTATFIPV